MTFSIGQLQFIDSLQFMNRRSTNPQTEDLFMTSRGLSDSELALLRQKGVYPYEYVDIYERFDETKLPPKEAFYNQLSREHISDAVYQLWSNYWRHA